MYSRKFRCSSLLRSKSRILSFAAFVFVVVRISSLQAQSSEIIVDDFDGGGDSSLAGSYFAFGEQVLGQGASVETSTVAYNSIQSRTLQETAGNAVTWGVGVQRSFNAGTVDVSVYENFGLQLYSDNNDSIRTVFVELVTFDPVGQVDVVHQLKSALRPKLNSAYQTWQPLEFPLSADSFVGSGPMNFDQLKYIKVLISNENQGTANRTVYFDDVRFFGTTPPPPAVSLTGIVDLFDQAGDASMVGDYTSFGETNLGAAATSVSSDVGFESTLSRKLVQTAAGGSGWGVLAQKSFASGVVDVSGYDTIKMMVYSADDDLTRTIDIELVFDDVANGGIAIYSLKQTAEPTLASAYETWQPLEVALDPSLFDLTDAGPFDLTNLKHVNVFIANNGYGADDRTIYFDDIKFLQKSGLMDDFEGNSDSLFAGTYGAYGETNLGAAASSVELSQYHSFKHARKLEQTETGGQTWGMGVGKTFQAMINVAQYERINLKVYSEHDDQDGRSFDVELFFDDPSGGVAIYSLKSTEELAISQAFESWQDFSVPLDQSKFIAIDAGPFDLTRLEQIHFLIKNNGAGSAARKVYFDDIRFETDNGVPVPQNVLSTHLANNIKISWDALNGVDGYKVYRRGDALKPQPSDLIATITGSANNDYEDVTPTKEVPHFYRVTAFSGNDESELSPDTAIGTLYNDSWAPQPEVLGGLTHIARVSAGKVIYLTDSGQKDFIAGINVGASVPGYAAGDMAISREVYRRWFSQISGLGFRAIRIYTLHPPRFYEELRDYNLANPDTPLYLFHGAWVTEEALLNQTEDLFNTTVYNAFKQELEDIVDAVHGDLVRAPQPGQASGTYTADVSPWLSSYVIGIELEPHVVEGTDDTHVGMQAYSGVYFQSAMNASPTEIWYAEMFDHLATQAAARGVCMPLSTSNWSTTDPLTHPQEPNPGYEDLVGLDMNNIVATTAWPAGHYANYHAYPYYPDFMLFEPGIKDFVYNGQVDPYAGYIQQLKDHHAAAGIPLVITEYGVPASIGNAHAAALGRDQGGHTEQEQMAINSDLQGILKGLGTSGSFAFMWNGEWFKTTWNVSNIHIPAGRRWYWQNAWANESFFGIVITEPGIETGVILDGDDSEWDTNGSEVIFSDPQGDVREMRAFHDAAYLYLMVEMAQDDQWDTENLMIGFDVLPTGNQGLPFNPGVDNDADYAMSIGPNAEANSYVATWNDPVSILYGYLNNYFLVDSASIQPGSGEWVQQSLLLRRPIDPVPNTNPPESYDVQLFDIGDLIRGNTDPDAPAFNSLANWEASGKIIEIRIPYAQLGFGDPSTRQAITVDVTGQINTVTVADIGISILFDGVLKQTDGYIWSDWNTVEWHQRLKRDIDVFSQAIIDSQK